MKYCKNLRGRGGDLHLRQKIAIQIVSIRYYVPNRPKFNMAFSVLCVVIAHCRTGRTPHHLAESIKSSFTTFRFVYFKTVEMAAFPPGILLDV